MLAIDHGARGVFYTIFTFAVWIFYSTVYSDTHQRKHQSPASLAFMRGIHRWPVNSPHKGPVLQIMFPFDNVIMLKLRLFLLPWPHTNPLFTSKSECLFKNQHIVTRVDFELPWCVIFHYLTHDTDYLGSIKICLHWISFLDSRLQQVTADIDQFILRSQ